MSNIYYYQQKLFLLGIGPGTKLIFFSHLIRNFFPFSTTVNEHRHPKDFFMVDYLVNSCGFSRERAQILSRDVTHINSPEKPDSVLKFLKKCSFNEANIRNLITQKPTLLASSVDKTLKPKFRVFQNLGMSGTDLAELIISNPAILKTGVDKRLLPCVKFLRTHLQSDEKITGVLKKYSWLLFYDAKKVLLRNVSVLQSCSVSNHRISKLISKYPRLFTQKPGWLEEIVERVEKFGVSRGSRTFLYAVCAISSMSKSTVDSKFEFFKSYGWSETDILTAFQKVPFLLTTSESKMQRAMDFFLNELHYEPSYFALHPTLLRFNLEKRIIHRHNVMKILKSKKLVERNHTLSTMACWSEKKFLEKYVLRYQVEAPEVYELYMQSMKALPSVMNC